MLNRHEQTRLLTGWLAEMICASCCAGPFAGIICQKAVKDLRRMMRQSRLVQVMSCQSDMQSLLDENDALCSYNEPLEKQTYQLWILSTEFDSVRYSARKL